MDQDRYKLESTSDYLEFWFFSEGPQGSIKKVIQFENLISNLFSLAFGDWNESSKTIDVLARTDNQDRDKIFATIAFSILEFIKHYPNAKIYFIGSTPARTRLYQMAIFANWREISLLFDITGYINDEWKPITKNNNYEAFLVTSKKSL